MAHTIDVADFEIKCPRCDGTKITVMTFHFGATYTCECEHCGFGHISGEDRDNAISRYRGQVIESIKIKEVE